MESDDDNIFFVNFSRCMAVFVKAEIIGSQTLFGVIVSKMCRYQRGALCIRVSVCVFGLHWSDLLYNVWPCYGIVEKVRTTVVQRTQLEPAIT